MSNKQPTNPVVTGVIGVATLGLAFLLWTHGGQTVAAGLAVMVANAYFLHASNAQSQAQNAAILDKLLSLSPGTVNAIEGTFAVPTKTSATGG